MRIDADGEGQRVRRVHRFFFVGLLSFVLGSRCGADSAAAPTRYVVAHPAAPAASDAGDDLTRRGAGAEEVGIYHAHVCGPAPLGSCYGLSTRGPRSDCHVNERQYCWAACVHNLNPFGDR